MIPNIVGFHTNSKSKCSSFLRGGFLFSHDTFWLGYGMYFWDNFSNSKWWKKERLRKDKINCSIVAANLELSNLLDLTDEDVATEFQNLWTEYCRLNNDSINQPLGKKIDLLFDYFSLEDQFKVVRGIGNYPNRRTYTFLHWEGRRSPSIDNKARMIYVVRQREALSNEKLLAV
ncbi:hypothetical protein C8N40_102529 [Pontibacter mucosus]|uniref:Uncharacterized protein n=1 Tax=Pontibacter mucosus TaxID=1649266 RepID=A0A2T5YQG5_9BACT|nr:hypothetical protein [Pontibacter mucosus]PTX21553.1 hypothetical protein C8N40_102529 [Pontibacter mucosus]